MSRIFISHSNLDKQVFVRRFADHPRKLGHSVWYDEWSIRPGESLALRIQQGISECDFFVIVISENSINSRWVQREVNDALVSEIERGRTIVIPIVIGTVKNGEIPLTLRARKYVDFRGVKAGTGAYSKVFQEIADAVSDLRDVGSELSPLFECPRCVEQDLSKAEGFHISILDIICLENGIEKGQTYDAGRGEAGLFFYRGATTTQPVKFKLAESDLAALGPKARPFLWRTFGRSEGRNGVLKIQFSAGRKKHVLLYWINYAIERYLESRVRELANDWDFEVTMKNIQP